MTRPGYFWRGKTLICIWILFQLFTVSLGRRYDKCVTGDGRQGVCVIKRYCREASHQELLLCGDEENHCCPIPTTQRSAQSFPKTPERPREDERHRTEPNSNDKTPPVIREYDRDDRLNKTPPPEDRRSLTWNGNERPKKVPLSSPKSDEYDGDRRRPYPIQGNSQEVTPDRARSPSRHDNERPKKVPSNVPSNDKPEEYDKGTRRPSQGNAQKVTPERPRDLPQNRPSARPKESDRRNPPVRRPDSDGFYPAKDELDTSRDTGPPRRVTNDRPSSKNRTADDPSKAPIRFPEPYEFSVPRPKVPACGVKPYELFIAGGQESEEHEWPWMTAIFRRYPDSRPKTFLCGGALINTKYVLTAAHCFVNNYVILPASSFIVRLGSHFLDSGEEYTVGNLVIHHNHSGSEFFNDIALVRLASEVYITDKIAPICLPSPDMMLKNFVGRVATVAGWGDTAFRTSGSRILQHVKVPVVSGEECFAAYSRVRGAAFLARGSDHVICAGLREGGKDACLGDSGGPLMIKMPDDRWVIVGIVSLGYKCAEPGYPGVYTRVTHYMSWINTNMKKY